MSDQPPPPPGNYPPPPPPPPGGGYPPPPGGGYPPPPPPGGGGYPPPPQQGGYAPPPPQGAPGYPPPQAGYGPPGGAPPVGFGGAQPFSIGDAFSWAWNKFTSNAVALIVPALVYAVILSIVYGIVYGLSFALAPDTVTTYDSYGSGFEYSASASLGAASIAVLVLGGIVMLVLVAAAESAYLGGVFDIANGQPVSIGSFFKPRNIGGVILTSIIVSILTSIGYALCVLPGLAVAILTIFAVPAVIDRNMSPIDAIKHSIEIARANIGPVILTWLMMVVVVFVGALVCGIGLIVAIPVASLLLVYTYRKLSGGALAELNPQPLPPGPPQMGPPPVQ